MSQAAQPISPKKTTTTHKKLRWVVGGLAILLLLKSDKAHAPKP